MASSTDALIILLAIGFICLAPLTMAMGIYIFTSSRTPPPPRPARRLPQPPPVSRCPHCGKEF